MTQELAQWEGLFPELQWLALSFLRAKDLCSMMLVNKKCHALASKEDLWRLLYFRETSIIFPDQNALDSSTGRYTWRERYKYQYHTPVLLYSHSWNENSSHADVALTLSDKGIKAVGHHYIQKRSEYHEKEWLADIEDDVLSDKKVILFYANGGMRWDLREVIGNLLAEFVDAGNAVIISCFSNAGRGETPGGFFEAMDYGPIMSASQENDSITYTATAGIPKESVHPILQDVGWLETGYASTGKLHDKATQIASFTNRKERPLVAERKFESGGIVLSLNVFLPSERSGVAAGRWVRYPPGETQNDMDIFLHNACRYCLHHVLRNPKPKVQTQPKEKRMARPTPEELAYRASYVKDLEEAIPFQLGLAMYGGNPFFNPSTPAPAAKKCEACKKQADTTAKIKFSKCGGCKKVWYCNRACQKKDWPHHKQICKK